MQAVPCIHKYYYRFMPSLAELFEARR
jgi:hypothetical protein